MSFEEIAKALHKDSLNKGGSGNTACWVAKDKEAHFEPYSIDRRELADEDIRIQITYAGEFGLAEILFSIQIYAKSILAD